MRHTIEKSPSSSPDQPSPEEKMANIIRAKLARGLTLTETEEAFLREQKRENWRDDNPRYEH
ncbi:hypothetical protein A2917_00180 [Candidatus Nomurabacteria bacterium RIFCSPLOWO2_01_FULL_42_17]|uniref:Uncharacterized protein n=1 Tax=Candidatus Nomurabacteria bacterium RIFCSPLOWO2_01_FULL_42_17 TaxID=1801780 RepID=A0A1F6XNK8_9BACT|nr:MAG: hypothetical protein A2917_00180 [Candidatus Nomurabacteria bacterium RIFCSPLOWO2_01_FULL_42_17]